MISIIGILKLVLCTFFTQYEYSNLKEWENYVWEAILYYAAKQDRQRGVTRTRHTGNDVSKIR
jgi:hypothetical protein